MKMASLPKRVPRDLVRVSDDDQKESLPSDPFTAASGRFPRVPAVVLVPKRVSAPFRTDLINCHSQRAQEMSLLPLVMEASAELSLPPAETFTTLHKEPERSWSSIAAISSSAAGLRDPSRVGENDQKEVTHSNLPTAASGGRSLVLASVFVPKKASVPSRTDPTDYCPPRARELSPLPLAMDASTESSLQPAEFVATFEKDLQDPIRAGDDESKEAPLSDLLAATSGGRPLVPASACVPDGTSAEILATTPGNLVPSYCRNEQTEEYPPEDRGPGPPSILFDPEKGWLAPSDMLETDLQV